MGANEAQNILVTNPGRCLLDKADLCMRIALVRLLARLDDLRSVLGLSMCTTMQCKVAM